MGARCSPSEQSGASFAEWLAIVEQSAGSFSEPLAISEPNEERKGPQPSYRSPSEPEGAGRSTYATGSAAGSFSTRIAVALNSAVPDFGSHASIVSRFVATSSWKCSVMNVSPGRSDSSIRIGASI